MIELLEYVKGLNVIGWIVVTIVLLLIIREGYVLLTDVAHIFGIKTKKSLEQERQKEQINRLENSIEEYHVRRLDDLSNSNACNARFEKSIDHLTNKLDDISSMVTDMQANSEKTKRVELKDRISQHYREISTRQYSNEEPVPYWTSMEQEALRDLITEYEAHGGENSFVHTVVEPESYTWKLIHKL